ncbi:hypothetical protein CTA2_7390 [Colletotrichum tanaceti]|uniref:ToxB-like N-terminal ascomycota domain-containing protein n=1 Tax=Colletotrichum tanaceti TaxID=1306861 RepID=A0A4V6DH92_9PEZI|nr:hypothetical protein CTA2_7390 [Colletotrichum tanaceti]TKW55726.1 hypothetical protein CTA1_10662 [Colletotrichum tanaceti]
MKFTATICLVASYAGLAAAAIGCKVEILNFSSAVVGSGCVPFNSDASIYDPNTRAGYRVRATNDCGLSLEAGQSLPANYSLRKAGYCQTE